MLAKSPFNQLKQLGLDIWWPKPAKDATIIPEQIRINARCLVLQFNPQPLAALAEVKILQGMLSVLELAAHEFMHVRITKPQSDFKQLNMQIQQWSPQFILQLDMEQPALARENTMQTYSPHYLLQNQQYKAQAYKTLLSLRAKLHEPSN